MTNSATNGLIDQPTVFPVRLPDAPRIAILGSPRCGNTWLRRLLSHVYAIPDFCEHCPDDFCWDRLPSACVLQIHWHPVESFIRRLEENGFHIVVMSRHPFDVLISILHFSLHDQTGRWLEGAEGNERSIYGAMPRSTAFLEYAVGNRAAALLSVSLAWWNSLGCTQVFYEALNRDPVGELQRIVDECGGRPRKSLEEIVVENSIPKLRAWSQNQHHFWMGRPGLWKCLLTSEETIEIAEVLKPRFCDFNYDWDADSRLNASQADANWIKLVWVNLAEDLQVLRTTKRDLENIKKQAETNQRVLEQDLGRLKNELASTIDALKMTRKQLAPFLQLGPVSLGMAFKMRSLSLRYPWFSNMLKYLVRRQK